MIEPTTKPKPKNENEPKQADENSEETKSDKSYSRIEQANLLAKETRSLKSNLHGAFWWPLVQDEVRERVDLVLDNLSVLGPLFRDAFVAGFQYEYSLRAIEGISVPNDDPGALFGQAMSEEIFQSGVNPTKLVLGLSTWTEPNDADVQACMTICHKIDQMQEKGLVKAPVPPSECKLLKTTKVDVEPADPSIILKMMFGDKNPPHN